MSKTPITLTSVSLGDRTIQVPMARLEGDKPGPTLLITGGNDGDEYAGIEACYRIIEEFSHTSFSGTLTIIPVVNIPGFEAEKSENPADGKFPKCVFPGRADGTSTERLRYWLYGIAKQSDFWLDLHDGALTERLVPFVHARKSHNSALDQRVQSLINHMPVSYAVFEDVPFIVKDLASHGCGYLLCESGSFGKRDVVAINRHIQWSHTVMSQLRMVQEPLKQQNKHIFANVQTYTLTKNGLWISHFPVDNVVTKGAILGSVQSVEGKISETITAKQNGILLWGKEGLRATAGNCVAGVGYNEIPSNE